MRSLLALTLAVIPAIALGQNGATAVAAKALAEEAAPCDTDAATGVGCHAHYPAGCALPGDGKGNFKEPDLSFRPGYDPYLAYFKNQIPKVLPTSQGFLTKNDFVSKYRKALKVTPKITSHNHAAVSDDMLGLGEGQYFSVIGYLYYEKLSDDGEASNCDIQKNDPSDDYHIGIGFDSTLAKAAPTAKEGDAHWKLLEKASIVVEMTPHYRAKFHKGKWTRDVLTSVLGRQVKVVGQLLLDNDHMGASAVCSAPGATANCWRLSPWELHPVTEFYVCKARSTCGENSSDWIPLDNGTF